jgi:hypothetical protein
MSFGRAPLVGAETVGAVTWHGVVYARSSRRSEREFSPDVRVASHEARGAPGLDANRARGAAQLARQDDMTPEDFLVDYEDRGPWSLPDGSTKPGGFAPVAAFTGLGKYGLEVALATVDRRPRADELRRVWSARYGKAPIPLLLIAAYKTDDGWKASICGPVGDEPPAEGDLELGEVERIAAAALAEPSRNAAIRFLGSIWAELENELPGLRNQGMFASHELRDGLPLRPDWKDACARGRALLGFRGRELVERLGFSVQTHASSASVLSVKGTKRAVAVFLDEGEDFETSGKRFGASSPVSHGLAVADREGLPWVVLTRGRQIRIYASRPETGVGRKGRSETFVEANLALLPDERAGAISLLFSADALQDRGSFEEILEESRDYSADLGVRLRERVYSDAVPSLAVALAGHQPGELDEAGLEYVYEQALTVLFRLLFVAYAEDKDLLPYRSNGAYREHALKSMARDLAGRRAAGQTAFDPNATDLWDNVSSLWLAVDKGNVEWGVPVYDGGLFSSDPAVSAAGAALEEVRLANADFGPSLVALLVDEADDGVSGPVDFRSLSVREFGTIYEGLLESRLSVAPGDLTLDPKGTYVPAAEGSEIVVRAGGVYFHNRSGARKATGSYFTKHFAVEHLLDQALEPAIDEHVGRVAALLEEGEEARAADAFFDFRTVDLAMGSGHFLVAALDRVEARLSAFLALHPIPNVTIELDRLRAAAVASLGPLGEGVEIEQATLLRRQVARRCIYGVDANPTAVELARLAIWIHTFVPGLPLSFLDHSLVCGDSLTGIGTIDEAIQALDPEHQPGQASLFREQVLSILSRSEVALTRLARISETSKADVEEARQTQEEATRAIGPACDLFDLILGGRLGIAPPLTRFEEVDLETNGDLTAARALRAEMNAIHFPISFPEVFLGPRAGFDCILGNPPWEKLQVEKHSYYALQFPGLRGLKQAEAEAEIARIDNERPDVREAYERETERVQRLALALSMGPYPDLAAGRPDLYKAFAWRFLQLLAPDARCGVVLPRKAVEASGMARWRLAALESGGFSDLTLLLNKGRWVFDDVEPRYTVALVAFHRGGVPRLDVRGPFQSMAEYVRGMREPPIEITAGELLAWSASAAVPILASPDHARVFAKIRGHPGLSVRSDGWAPKGLRELNASDDRRYFRFEEAEGRWPVYKGESFDLWTPDTGHYYAFADPATVVARLKSRQLNQIRTRRSAFYGLSRAWAEDESSLPAMRPRIAWRDSTNRTNQRTIIAALVPPLTVLVHQAYYIFWRQGDERDEAYVLGLMSSIPFDWYARQLVESHATVELVDGAPIPRVARDTAIRRRVEMIAGRLAAIDERYEGWAAVVGVPVGGANGPAEKMDLVAELDAAVSLLYGLDDDDVRVVFETFHEGWDYRPRLDAVLAKRRSLR